MQLDERNPAGDLIDGGLLVGSDQPFHKQVVQIFSGEAALKHAVFRHRDGAGLLRNDNDNGIRILAHSDGGTMPGAKALVNQLFFLRFREEAGCCQNLSVPHNDRTVVERCLIIEDVAEQLLAGDGIQNRAVVDLLPQPGLPFDDDQRTC